MRTPWALASAASYREAVIPSFNPLRVAHQLIERRLAIVMRATRAGRMRGVARTECA